MRFRNVVDPIVLYRGAIICGDYEKENWVPRIDVLFPLVLVYSEVEDDGDF